MPQFPDKDNSGTSPRKNDDMSPETPKKKAKRICPGPSSSSNENLPVSELVRLPGFNRYAVSSPASEDILPGTNLPPGQASAAEATTIIDYMASLHILSMSDKIRLTGIVCTIGPVSRKPEFLLEMLKAGMNIARMNFSHGSHEFHAETIKNCREAADKFRDETKFDPCLSIALDTKGPEIRTGLLDGDDGTKEIRLVAGEKIKITTDNDFREKCTKDVLWVDYKNITKVLTPGKRIFIDDGLISVQAQVIGSNFVIGKIENGGALGSRKGCNLPGTDTDLPAVSDKDKLDLMFGVEQDVDMVFASFIRNADGVKAIRKLLGEKGKNILIIPKIENQQGVNNIDEIIAESDGIMVARGDMGIEIPPEKVFVAQKQIIAKCNKAGKPVICATQMLESMVKKPRPTRAEASDVANAVLDGSDCVMLSGETAKGSYPIDCIKTMAHLAREAEACLWNQRVFRDLLRSEELKMSRDITTGTTVSAVQASYMVGTGAIIVLTTTGRTAHITSKFRPQCPILAVTRDIRVGRQMQLYRGIIPLYYPTAMVEDWMQDIQDRVLFGIGFAKENDFLKTGDSVVCITGHRKGPGSSNSIRIMQVE